MCVGRGEGWGGGGGGESPNLVLSSFLIVRNFLFANACEQN